MKKSLSILLILSLCLSFALGAAAEQENDYTVGNTVVFGHYEQDNDLENGKEPLEWIVLEATDTQAFLITKYVIDAHAYHTSFIPMTWAKCELRTWMNTEFFNELFTEEEQAMIPETAVVNRKNPHYSTPGGDDTVDRIFLLSIKESESYFKKHKDRQADPTLYARARGVYYDKKTGRTWWWLRSPGVRTIDAAGVRADGRVSGYGSRDVYRKSGGIRPVVWVNIGE